MQQVPANGGFVSYMSPLGELLPSIHSRASMEPVLKWLAFLFLRPPKSQVEPHFVCAKANIRLGLLTKKSQGIRTILARELLPG